MSKYIHQITPGKVNFIFDENSNTFYLKPRGILFLSEINEIYRFCRLDIPKRFASTFDKSNKHLGDFLARCYLMRGGIIPKEYVRKRKKIKQKISINNTLPIPFKLTKNTR